MQKKIQIKENKALYTGSATITLRHGKRPYKTVKQHNRGTPLFFQYIMTNILGGHQPEKRPRYLWLLNTNLDNERILAISFKTLYESTPQMRVNTDNSVTAVYTFLIPDMLLPSTFTIDGLAITGLDVTEFSMDQVYAIVNLDDAITVDSPNTNLYITWELNIGNRTERVTTDEV